MSEYIEGKLVLAGEYVGEQVDPAAPLARVVVVMPRESLAAVRRLPMYDDVAVVPVVDRNSWQARAEKAEAALAAAREGTERSAAAFEDRARFADQAAREQHESHWDAKAAAYRLCAEQLRRETKAIDAALAGKEQKP